MINHCPVHPYAFTTCDDCRRAAGWPVKLKPEELAELRNRLLQDQRVDLSRLTRADRIALRPFDRRRRRKASPPSWTGPAQPARASRANDVIGEIAERLVASVHGAPLLDPRGFLRNADPNALASLLSSEDFNVVMELRAQSETAAAATAPEPAAPKRSREDLEGEVRSRHARGESVNDIAAGMGLGRTLVTYILDK